MKQRIYLIGSGTISHHHANACNALPRETELYAADPSPVARASFKEAFPEAILFESSEEMLAHAPAQEFDIVVVATPPAYHAPECIKALQSGRNVVCEKPFAMNMEEARQMVDEAKRLRLAVSCCSNRFIKMATALQVRELVQSATFGQPYLVDFIHRKRCNRTGIEYQPETPWFVDKSKNGGGALMDWGPYDAACLMHIFEPVKAIISGAIAQHIRVPHGVPEGVVFDIDTQTGATIQFELESGQTVVVRYERTCSTHGEEQETEAIYCTEGCIQWDWLPFTPKRRTSVKTTKAPDLANEIIYPVDNPDADDAWLFAPVHEMDHYLRGDSNAAVLVNDKALNNFSILRGIYDSAESGQPVTLNFQ